MRRRIGKMSDEQVILNSIGQVGQLYLDRDNTLSNNNRVKQVMPQIIDRSQLEQLVQQGIEYRDETQATRFTGVYLVEGNYQDIIDMHTTEVAVPLNNGYSGVNLVFAGSNTPERIAPQRIRVYQEEILEEVLARKDLDIAHPYGINFERLLTENLTEQDIIDLEDLYDRAFVKYTVDLNQDTIRNMVNDTTTYVARDQENAKIVAASVAEIAPLNTGRGLFRFCEISEMATLPEYRSRGISTYLTAMMINEIRENVDFLHAQARAVHPAVNHVFRKLGFDAQGILPQHCIIAGRTKNGELVEEGLGDLRVYSMLPQHIGEGYEL